MEPTTGDGNNFDEVVKRCKSDSTRSGYQNMGRRFINYCKDQHPELFEDSSYEEFKFDEVEDYVLKGFFESCAKWNVVRSKPDAPVPNTEKTIESYICSLIHFFDEHGKPLSKTTTKMLRKFKKGASKDRNQKIAAGEIADTNLARVSSP